MNKLEQLKKMTTVVADTGDIIQIQKYKPIDATTNPSLILKASQQAQYAPLLQQACEYAQKNARAFEQESIAADKLATLIGKEILGIIEGRVSTEVDSRLSFDSRGTIEKARHFIQLYNDIGIDQSRVLIKIAATWEGIQAAKVLEKEGIHCNLTLLFSFEQAQACADVGVYLISPFVGRILDWHKANTDKKTYTPEEDPGVLSVRAIYEHYKINNYKTIIMGASFRSTGQVEALAGCDYLTISPALLEELSNDEGHLAQALDANAHSSLLKSDAIKEPSFRWAMNANAMASDKLAEGIRLFTKDQEILEQSLYELMGK